MPKLFRAQSFTGSIIQIDAPTFTAPGIALKNFTICGGIDVIRDINTATAVNLGTSSVGCPRQQVTLGTDGESTGSSCGDMTYRLTRATEVGGPPARSSDFLCSDIEVIQADTGEYNGSPFPSTTHYSLEIANLDLEDAAGHALTLYENGSSTAPKHINDLHIHGNAINGSAVTGILHGSNDVAYHANVCDSHSNWLNDPAVFAPRNIRIEGNTFSNNNTGAMGSGAVRWTRIQGNVFTNNYIHPQVGNSEGGVIGFDPCADTVQIIGNQFIAPTVYAYGALGVEMYSRNVTIQGNTISGFPLEGIALNGVNKATVETNTVTNNGAHFNPVGGVNISTTEPITGPCGDARDSRDIILNGNTSTGQPYGVYISGHDLRSTATLRRTDNPYAVALTGNILTGNTYAQVGQDSIVTLDSYSGPDRTPFQSHAAPRALPVKAVSPITSRCSTSTAVQTFAFAGADAAGKANVFSIEAMFSVPGDDKDGTSGPGNGAQGCHFIYYPADNKVYLDGPDGGSLFNAGNSVVGSGGSDVTNGYCTIQAGATPASMTEPYISPYIQDVRLVISFPRLSGKKHIYTVVRNIQQVASDGGAWKYWGWWDTQ